MFELFEGAGGEDVLGEKKDWRSASIHFHNPETERPQNKGEKIQMLTHELGTYTRAV